MTAPRVEQSPVEQSPVAVSVEQPTGHPTEKLWAVIVSGSFTTAVFSALADYGIEVKPGTQGLITLLLVTAAGYFMKNREPSGF